MRLRASIIALVALVLTDVPAHEPIRTLSRFGAVAVPLVATQPPARVALSPAAQGRVDALVAGAIADERIPGCVVIIGNKSGVLFRRAYGQRVVGRAAMTPDTVFDLASLTKAVATTTAVLQLQERGAITLEEPVRRWLPELSGSDITARQLLTHSSGLPADNALERYEHGHAAAIAAIAHLAHAEDPGTRYQYSDLCVELAGRAAQSRQPEERRRPRRRNGRRVRVLADVAEEARPPTPPSRTAPIAPIRWPWVEHRNSHCSCTPRCRIRTLGVRHARSGASVMGSTSRHR